MSSPKQAFQLDVEVVVRQDGNWNNSLRVHHSVQLGSLDFLELAQVLGRFHELGETIRKERNDDSPSGS